MLSMIIQFVEVIPFNDNLMLSLNSLVDMFPHTEHVNKAYLVFTRYMWRLWD